MNQQTRALLAVGLWVLSASLMVGATVDDAVDGFAWGVFAGLGALAVTNWLMSERRDHLRDRSVEHVVEVVEALHAARNSTRNLR